MVGVGGLFFAGFPLCRNGFVVGRMFMLPVQNLVSWRWR
jgi:hypothetical protein